GPGSFTMGGQPMSTVAMQLSRVVGRIVVDKTNLQGAYDLTLTYQPDPGLVGRGDLPPLLNGVALISRSSVNLRGAPGTARAEARVDQRTRRRARDRPRGEADVGLGQANRSLYIAVELQPA